MNLNEYFKWENQRKLEGLASSLKGVIIPSHQKLGEVQCIAYFIYKIYTGELTTYLILY